VRSESELDRTWRHVARASGYITGGAFLAGTVLYLLDATDVLAASVEFHSTGAGLHDEATYWVAYFARQHDILWDIIARDTLFPLAFVALIVLSLAIRHLVGDERPDAQVMTTLFTVGGVFAALSDLLYLGATDFWRVSGWTPDPAAGMVAVGRSSQALESLTRWPEAAGFVVLAGALVCLGRLCAHRPELPQRTATLVYLEAVLLVGAAIAEAAKADTTYDIFSLLTGAIVAPALTVWLGWHLGRGTALPRV
jgi:hypothetical protein